MLKNSYLHQQLQFMGLQKNFKEIDRTKPLIIMDYLNLNLKNI